jgi:hypothetical protein
MGLVLYRLATCGGWVAVSVVLSLVWCSPATADTLNKCLDGSGHVSYQQRPCDGGTGVQVTTKSASPQPVDTQTVSVPVPLPAQTPPRAPAAAGAVDQSRPALPATPPAEARGRLNGYPAAGYGLSVGMTGNDVIKRWGRPHEINVVNGDAVFFHYCDLRVAFIFRGELVSWSALFPDGEKGAALYNYGEPWTDAVQKWGAKRDRRAFMSNSGDTGDVEKWAPNRWVVTDAQGYIVSWCDAANYRPPVTPPQNITAWE